MYTTYGSAVGAVRNGGSGVFVKTPTGQTVSYSNATGRKCSNFKAETSALQNAVAYIPVMKPLKNTEQRKTTPHTPTPIFGNMWTEGLRPKIHGYTGCKRTRFVKPDSIKLAMGHLLHGKSAP